MSWQGNKNGWELLQSAYADDAAENEEDLQGEDEDENSEDEDENNEGDVGMRPPPGQENTMRWPVELMKARAKRQTQQKLRFACFQLLYIYIQTIFSGDR